MMHLCGCHPRHRHEYGSSSNFPNACREWEDAWVVVHRHRCHRTRLVVVGNYHHHHHHCYHGTTVAVATAVASVAAIVECVLLMCRDIDVGQGLLTDSHTELLDVRQLALHSDHGGCLGLH